MRMGLEAHESPSKVARGYSATWSTNHRDMAVYRVGEREDPRVILDVGVYRIFFKSDPSIQSERLIKHQDLHCIKPDYIDPNMNVKLYDYIQARFSSSSTSPTKTSPRSTSTWSFVAANKNAVATVIFDHRRRLGQDPPPLQNRCHLKPRRRRRIPAVAA
jgi:hypothetical protein